jgi:hypothetical protein
MSRSLAVALFLVSLACCARGAVTPSAAGPSMASPAPPVALRPASDQRLDAGGDDGGGMSAVALGDAAGGAEDADATVVPFDDPMTLHLESPDGLRALMGEAAAVPFSVGGGPWRMSQGNRAIAKHAIGRRACLEGLRNVVLQTPEQRARCGADGMVPVWDRGGSIDTARFCIDVFEFPGKPCELPFVFVTPPQALRVCHAQGKRLCTQDEWNQACRADPAGGPDRVYAYGDDLDLTVCNTNKTRTTGPSCDVSNNERLWTTCGTNTEPNGAYPKCRSRFGVFDQHGNVAEIMTRYDTSDRTMYTQLKGSAFFYVDVAKKPSDPGGYWTKYPDQCNFDPRWHVEKLEEASHMNYHLGFRCCKALNPVDAGSGG